MLVSFLFLLLWGEGARGGGERNEVSSEGDGGTKGSDSSGERHFRCWRAGKGGGLGKIAKKTKKKIRAGMDGKYLT